MFLASSAKGAHFAREVGFGAPKKLHNTGDMTPLKSSVSCILLRLALHSVRCSRSSGSPEVTSPGNTGLLLPLVYGMACVRSSWTIVYRQTLNVEQMHHLITSRE